jgi:hypothetical protein
MRKLLQNDLIVKIPLGLIYYLRSIIDRGCVYGGPALVFDGFGMTAVRARG